MLCLFKRHCICRDATKSKKLLEDVANIEQERYMTTLLPYHFANSMSFRRKGLVIAADYCCDCGFALLSI